MENNMTCPKCGQPLPGDSTFCQFCGTNIEEERARVAEQEARKTVIDEASKELICPKCGHPLPEGSAFCQFCGIKIEDEHAGITERETLMTAKTAEETGARKEAAKKGVVCPKCGQSLPDDSTFCQYCGESIANTAFPAQTRNKDVSRLGENKNETPKLAREKNPFKVATIALSIVSVLLLGLCIFQFISVRANGESSSQLEAQVESLKSELSEKNSTISNLKERNKNSEAGSNAYNTICDVASVGSIGYATDNFHSSTGLIIMNAGSEKTFRLTANWPDGGTVDWEYTGNSAYITLDEDSWYTDTYATVYAEKTGITRVDFSNDVDNSAFSMIIIVK